MRQLTHDPLMQPDYGAATIDWDDPINRGTVSRWAFNDGAGGRLSDLIGQNHGMLGGFANNAWQGGGLNFNGLSYVSLGRSLYSIASTLTIVCWFRAATTTGGQAVINFGDRLQVGIGSPAGTVSNGILGAEYYDGSFRPLSSGVAPTIGKRQHIAFTSFPAGHELYLDGAISASNALTSPIVYVTSRDTRIGAQYTGERWLTGAVDCIAIFNRAMSANEINRTYRDGPYFGLVGDGRRFRGSVSAARRVLLRGRSSILGNGLGV